jgi:hypothetical protein
VYRLSQTPPQRGGNEFGGGAASDISATGWIPRPTAKPESRKEKKDSGDSAADSLSALITSNQIILRAFRSRRLV